MSKGEKFAGNGLAKKILSVVKKIKEPLETSEIIEKLGKKATRSKVMYRLIALKADQKINGKQLRAGKGVWIWWSK